MLWKTRASVTQKGLGFYNLEDKAQTDTREEAEITTRGSLSQVPSDKSADNKSFQNLEKGEIVLGWGSRRRLLRRYSRGLTAGMKRKGLTGTEGQYVRSRGRLRD